MMSFGSHRFSLGNGLYITRIAEAPDFVSRHCWCGGTDSDTDVGGRRAYVEYSAF